MSTHNLCFEQEYEKYQNFLSENFPFSVVKFSTYLNRFIFVMIPAKVSAKEVDHPTTHLSGYIALDKRGIRTSMCIFLYKNFC